MLRSIFSFNLLYGHKKGKISMNLKKMMVLFSLLLSMLLLMACNNDSITNENDKSVLESKLEGKVFTENNLYKMMVTGNPKSISTKLTFTGEDAWSNEQMDTSFIAFDQFKYWTKGTVDLDEEGKVISHMLTRSIQRDYSFDENGLRSTVHTRSGSVTSRIEERQEGDYIAEYSTREDTGEETLLGKYVKDSEGLIIKKIDCYYDGNKTYDIDYEYENGNLTKVTQSTDGVYGLSREIEYDILPVKLTLNNNNDLKLVYTFDYEFDDVGNWIKCNKYEDGKLIVTYERTIEY